MSVFAFPSRKISVFRSSLSQFFDSRVSPLNPANLPNIHYVYGQLPLFLLKIAALLAPSADFLLTGRFLSALFDCGTVLFSFLIARRLFSRHKRFRRSFGRGRGAAYSAQPFFRHRHFRGVLSHREFLGRHSFNSGKQDPRCDFMRRVFVAALACKISAALFRGGAGSRCLHVRAQHFMAHSFALFVLFCGHLLLSRSRPPDGVSRRISWAVFFDLRLDPRFWGEVTAQGAITRAKPMSRSNVQWIGSTPWLFRSGIWGLGLRLAAFAFPPSLDSWFCCVARADTRFCWSARFSRL
jgi:hypothetical protein